MLNEFLSLHGNEYTGFCASAIVYQLLQDFDRIPSSISERTLSCSIDDQPVQKVIAVMYPLANVVTNPRCYATIGPGNFTIDEFHFMCRDQVRDGNDGDLPCAFNSYPVDRVPGEGNGP